MHNVVTSGISQFLFIADTTSVSVKDINLLAEFCWLYLEFSIEFQFP